MYVIMCEIQEHSDYFHPDNNKTRLISAHPIFATKTLEEAHEWMHREPSIIVEHLNNNTDDTWFLTADWNETHAVIANNSCTKTRTYEYINVGEP